MIYPHVFEAWPKGVRRSGARLRYLRESGRVGLSHAAALVAAMRVCPRCRKKWTVYSQPERCDCGAELFGSWDRANHAMSDAARRERAKR